MPRLRLSLTIPGAVSLGAYEGGALAALILAAKALGEDKLVIDSIASASAGSMTALLTARSLLRDVDPVALLKAAWVDNVSFEAMKTHSTASLLSSAALMKMAEEVFGPGGIPEGGRASWQQEPVRVSMALAGLAGLTYQLPDLVKNTAVTASTYLDWYQVTLTNEVASDGYLTHAKAAIASGSNAFGFPAERLNRSDDRAQYEAAGLEPPGDWWFSYTDGGTVDNQPLGRTIDLAQGIESGGDDRLYLLIHPDSPQQKPSTVWSGSNATPPPWVRTGLHALGMSRSQSIYDDLRRLEKTNSRVQWVDAVARAVRTGVDAGIEAGNLAEGQANELRVGLMAALSGALGDLRGLEEHVERVAGREPAPRPVDPGGEWSDVLDTLVHAASGLEGRQPVKVEVVSPAVDTSDARPECKEVAGAFLGHFGGFFDIKFRRSDFALGYRNMRDWMDPGLAGYLPGVAPSELSAAFDTVAQRYVQLGLGDVCWGGASLGALSFLEKLSLVGLALHSARVVFHDALHGGV